MTWSNPNCRRCRGLDLADRIIPLILFSLLAVGLSVAMVVGTLVWLFR